MSAKERALKDMRDGVPWDILVKSHSKSRIYDAYLDFVKEMESKVSALRKNEKFFQRETARLEEEVARIAAKKTQEEAVLDKVNAETTQATQEYESVTRSLDKTRNQLEELNDSYLSIMPRGVHKEQVARYAVMDYENKEELEDRVSTAKGFSELSEEKQELVVQVKDLGSQKIDLAENVSETRSELSSVQNKLKIATSEHHLFLDAVEIVQKSLKKYPKRDIVSLFKAIEKIEVRGEPRTTLNYLLDQLGLVKQELEFETRVNSLKAEEKSVQQEVATIKGVLRAYQDSVVKISQEAKAIFEETIHYETQTATQAIKQLQQDFIDTFNDLCQSNTASMENMQEHSVNLLKNVQTNVWQKLFNLSLLLEARINICIEDSIEWGQVKEEAGQYRFYLNQAILMFGPLTTPEAILALDPWVVMQIAKRLHLYASRKFSGKMVKFPKSVARGEWAINDLYEINLTSITESLSLILDDVLRET